MERAGLACLLVFATWVVGCGGDDRGSSPSSTSATTVQTDTASTDTEPTTQEEPRSVPPIPAGRYLGVVTERGARRNGISEHEVLEQVGRFTMTLADGRFRSVQRSERPVRRPVFTGTYEGNRTQVAFTVETPTIFAGDGETLRWRFDGEALHFKLIRVTYTGGERYARTHYESGPWIKR